MTEFEQLDAEAVEEQTNNLNSTKYHVRWMIRRDMPEVLSIEGKNYSFLDPDFEMFQTTKLAWKEEDFLKHLRQKNVIGMVAEKREEVCGYVVYELYTSHIEINKLAEKITCIIKI